ncbi:MAG: alpha/beta hydrolase [Firmicutes bacterium]|nr:alpha/beta hydrolase [Bacillota bacterium]
MRIFDLPLEDNLEEGKPHLVAYLQEKMPADPEDYRLPAVVVYPGGGYMHLSPREAEPVAMEFASKGYQVFVLYYSLHPRRFPAPLLDGAKALNLIREHAQEWSVDPDKIAVCGFSAGGHAAALISCLWNDPVIAEAGLSNELAKPNASILCYPVITSIPGKCHEGSFQALLGENVDAKRGEMALETRVSELNPPTFLWHTAADQAVPVISSLLMAQALSEHKVPFELHVFPKGHHGLSLANRRTSGGNPDGEIPEVAQWIDLCCDWLARMFG